MSLFDRCFYYPNRVRYDSPSRLGLAHETVAFQSDGGPRLSGWFFPAVGEARGTVLHLHGNAGNMTGHFLHVAWLPGQGWNVLCFDYRGYGDSEGTVTREGTIADAHAALDYLLSRDDVDHTRIVAFGQSLGGAIGIVLAATRPEVKGLAVDGAFDSYRRIAAWHIRHNPLLLAVGWWVPSLAMSDDHTPIDHVGQIAPRPLFVMHGDNDHVVDPRMARRLYDAANEPKSIWMVEGADHYGALQEHEDEAQSRLIQFFASAITTLPS